MSSGHWTSRVNGGLNGTLSGRSGVHIACEDPRFGHDICDVLSM